MGGVHKDSLIGRTCVCWFVFEFLDKMVEGGSGVETLHSQLERVFVFSSNGVETASPLNVSPTWLKVCSPDTLILCR